MARAEDAPDAVTGDAVPDATVTVTGDTAAAEPGQVWGRGSLYYAGESREFSISAPSLVGAGAASISVTGEVYYLHKLSDFPGTYAVFAARWALTAGGTVAYLRNEHGVVIRVVTTMVGSRFRLAANGVSVRFTG